MKIDWFRLVFYCSLIFLFIWLLRNGSLDFPEIVSGTDLLYSLVLLFAAFLIDAYSWGFTLQEGGHKVSGKDYFVSSGLSVFAKYIPGKVFVILSRVLYLSKKGLIENGRGNSLSLFLQLTSIWAALLLGILWSFKIAQVEWLGIIWIGVFLLCTVWLYSSEIRNRINALLSSIAKRNIKSLGLGAGSTFRISFLMLMYWSLLALGFAFLLQALGIRADLSLALIFPFAAVAGIVAIFAPGGLGIREGMIVAALIYAGLGSQEATGISVLSRLWYFLGECFLFSIALSLKYLFKARKSE